MVKRVHHVREERITREIHTYDVFHRLQPIIDVEVLEPRHFLPVEGGLMEVDASQVPGRRHHWVIAETVSKGDPALEMNDLKRRPFTARTFAGTEGDYREYMHRDGYPVTEQTWIHPPELERGGYETGQTRPFHFKHIYHDPKTGDVIATPRTHGLIEQMGGERLAKQSRLGLEQRPNNVAPLA